MDREQRSKLDSLSVDSIYDGLDIDNNRWTEVAPDGTHVEVIGKDFENGLKRIHAFVDRVRNSEGPAFRFVTTRSGHVIAQRTRLSVIPTGAFIMSEFRKAYELSEQATVFLELEDELRLCDEHSFIEPLRESWQNPGRLVGEVANEFVRLLRFRTANKDFRRRVTERRHGFKENFRRGRAFVDALFRKWSRLVVVRVDLEYLNEHRPTLESAKADFETFLNNARHNAIFEFNVGCIWRLEYAIKTGYHFHVIFFFKGSHAWKDGYIAAQIGDYWKHSITKGRGRYHNCNFDKNVYKHVGIGVINDYDIEKRDALVTHALGYLTKIDELVRPVLPRGTKSFGTSHMPDPHSGKGRKRRRPSIGVSIDPSTV
jgi:hypothetical protein